MSSVRSTFRFCKEELILQLAPGGMLTKWCTMMTLASSWFVFRSSIWRVELFHTCIGVTV